jgi:F-type H+-transporting ATPase subunit epsilon
MQNPDAGSEAPRPAPSTAGGPALRLEVVSPAGSLFAGPVESVVFPAWDGLMGVLPGHAPLVAMLRPGAVRAHPAPSPLAPRPQPLSFQVTGGFADVGPTLVRLIADSVTAA